MHPLQSLLAERIAGGLRRKSITTTSAWAKAYRIMGPPFAGPWTFDHHAWLKEMLDCEAEHQVGQKAAQLGYTEVGLNKTFKALDIHGENVLYVLPSQNPDATDFSASRFDPALELSPHLQSLFTDRKNVGHKRAGTANLFIRGSRARNQLKSIPAALVIIDEKDEMVQENISLIPERMSGQIKKQMVEISTPTIEKYGINETFEISSQNHFFFKCPRCSRYIEFVWPDSVIITAESVIDPKIADSHYVCNRCHGVLDHASKLDWLSLENTEWVPQFEQRLVVGWYINQMYSHTVSPVEFSLQWMKAQTNPSDEQEFWNSKLGLPHAVKGARITDADIEDCIASHKMSEHAPPNAVITMGCDVGATLDYEICQWTWTDEDLATDLNVLADCKILKVGSVDQFEELDLIMRDFQIMACVIDANPEKRKSIEFAYRFWGHVWICYYATGITAKQIRIHEENEHAISVDRTAWMDASLGRVKTRKIKLPFDIPEHWKRQVKAPTRVYKKDQWDNPVGVYVKGNEPDHHAHARTYAEIALPLAATLVTGRDLEGIL